MDAGALDQRILVETPVNTLNELGEEVPGWEFLAKPWAKVMEGLGREFLKGDYVAESKAVFKIRSLQVDSKARVTWEGRVYRIDDVTGTRREGFSYLHCIAQGGAN